MPPTDPSSGYRTITLTQRPYNGIDLFDSIVDQINIQIDGKTYDGGPVFLEASRWIGDPVMHVTFDIDPEKAQSASDAANLDPKDLLFTVVLRGAFLKETAVIWSQQLSELISSGGHLTRDISVADYPHILQDSFGGFQIIYAVLVGRELDEQDLRPSAIGTWLLHEAISVQPIRSKSQFRTEPMSTDDKLQFRIPTTAATFVEIRESIATAEQLDSAATLYIDEHLYSFLNEQGRTAASQQVMMSIVIDFFMTLISHAVQRLAQSIDFESGEELNSLSDSSVLHYLLSRLADRSGQSVEFFLQELLRNPQILRSYLEAYYSELDGALNMLKQERLA